MTTKNIFADGLTVQNDAGEDVKLSPAMLCKISREIDTQNGRDAIACFTNNTFSDDQCLAVMQEIENRQSADSGNLEYSVMQDILGKNFDNQRKKYFFTFGSDEKFPYQNTYLVVIADSQEEAEKKFQKQHPNRPGSDCLNYAFCYGEAWSGRIKGIYPNGPAEIIC
jgi:hypothetical protein